MLCVVYLQVKSKSTVFTSLLFLAYYTHSLIENISFGLRFSNIETIDLGKIHQLIFLDKIPYVFN